MCLSPNIIGIVKVGIWGWNPSEIVYNSSKCLFVGG